METLSRWGSVPQGAARGPEKVKTPEGCGFGHEPAGILAALAQIKENQKQGFLDYALIAVFLIVTSVVLLPPAVADLLALLQKLL